MAYAVALDVWIAAHSAVYQLLFVSSSSSDGAALVVYDADDVELAAWVLDPAASGVDGVTGDLELVPVSATVTAAASGTASYALVTDDAGTALLRLPCTQGNTALAGECVLNTLALVSGGAVLAQSLVLPASDLLT